MEATHSCTRGSKRWWLVGFKAGKYTLFVEKPIKSTLPHGSNSHLIQLTITVHQSSTLWRISVHIHYLCVASSFSLADWRKRCWKLTISFLCISLCRPPQEATAEGGEWKRVPEAGHDRNQSAQRQQHPHKAGRQQSIKGWSPPHQKNIRIIPPSETKTQRNYNTGK